MAIQRMDNVLLRTPDGHGRIELAMFHTPKAISPEPKEAPANTLGIRRVMFAVDDIENTIARLRAHGAELVGTSRAVRKHLSALLPPRSRRHHHRPWPNNSPNDGKGAPVESQWRVTAEVPESEHRREAKLLLDENGARVVVSGEEHPIPREDVAKVYVFKNGFFSHGLCFQMKDPRDYVFWIRGGRHKAEEALSKVKDARYPTTQKVYKPYYGRLDRE